MKRGVCFFNWLRRGCKCNCSTWYPRGFTCNVAFSLLFYFECVLEFGEQTSGNHHFARYKDHFIKKKDVFKEVILTPVVFRSQKPNGDRQIGLHPAPNSLQERFSEPGILHALEQLLADMPRAVGKPEKRLKQTPGCFCKRSGSAKKRPCCFFLFG